MNLLTETYIFYVDVYVIQNFIIKIAVIYLTLYVNKCYLQVKSFKEIGKIVIVSFVATMMEIIALLISSSYHGVVLFVNLIEIPIMMRVILGSWSRKLVKIIVTGYFFIMLITAVVEALWNYFGEQAQFLLLLVFACVAVVIGVHLWKNHCKLQKGVYTVEIRHKKRALSAHAFYDSGNRLKDPYTGKGVHIISDMLWEKLDVGDVLPVYVPYQALGNTGAMLEVYYVDEVIISGEKERITRQNCPFGVTKEELFKEKQYEIILNEEVF